MFSLMYLQVSEKVVYGLSYVALYIIYTIYITYYITLYTLNNLYVMYFLKQPFRVGLYMLKDAIVNCFYVCSM
jgi:hypothetical protein